MSAQSHRLEPQPQVLGPGAGADAGRVAGVEEPLRRIADQLGEQTALLHRITSQLDQVLRVLTTPDAPVGPPGGPAVTPVGPGTAPGPRPVGPRSSPLGRAPADGGHRQPGPPAPRPGGVPPGPRPVGATPQAPPRTQRPGPLPPGPSLLGPAPAGPPPTPVDPEHPVLGVPRPPTSAVSAPNRTRRAR